MYCRHCGNDVGKEEACYKCGYDPLFDKQFCQNCGAETDPNQIVCIKCRAKLITRKNHVVVKEETETFNTGKPVFNESEFNHPNSSMPRISNVRLPQYSNLKGLIGSILMITLFTSISLFIFNRLSFDGLLLLIFIVIFVPFYFLGFMHLTKGVKISLIVSIPLLTYLLISANDGFYETHNLSYYIYSFFYFSNFFVIPSGIIAFFIWYMNRNGYEFLDEETIQKMKVVLICKITFNVLIILTFLLAYIVTDFLGIAGIKVTGFDLLSQVGPDDIMVGIYFLFIGNIGLFIFNILKLVDIRAHSLFVNHRIKAISLFQVLLVFLMFVGFVIYIIISIGSSSFSVGIGFILALFFYFGFVFFDYLEKDFTTHYSDDSQGEKI